MAHVHIIFYTYKVLIMYNTESIQSYSIDFTRGFCMGLREKKSIISFVLISYLQIKHRQLMNEEEFWFKIF